MSTTSLHRVNNSKINVYDQFNRLIGPNLKKNASPAEYFAGCLWLYNDLLHGGQELFATANKQEISLPNLSSPISNETTEKGALVLFISTLHEHSFFAPEKVFREENSLYPALQSISNLLVKNVDDPSVPITFRKTWKLFNIPGVARIEDTAVSNELNRLASVYKLENKLENISKEESATIAQLLRRAVFSGNVDDVLFLAQNFREAINIADDNRDKGFTALHIASQESNKHLDKIESFKNIINILKKYGAKNVLDAKEKKPVDYAKVETIRAILV